MQCLSCVTLDPSLIDNTQLVKLGEWEDQLKEWFSIRETSFKARAYLMVTDFQDLFSLVSKHADEDAWWSDDAKGIIGLLLDWCPLLMEAYRELRTMPLDGTPKRYSDNAFDSSLYNDLVTQLEFALKRAGTTPLLARPVRDLVANGLMEEKRTELIAAAERKRKEADERKARESARAANENEPRSRKTVRSWSP